MESRTLCISDIHGMYDQFCSLLKHVQYDPANDQLILLGDYEDRGPKSKDVIELVRNMVNEYGVIALRGNHDQMFLDFIRSDTYDSAFNFLRNGGMQTLECYCGLNWFEEGETVESAKEFIKLHFNHHIDFINQLPFYHENDHYIFVHAGLNPIHKDWKDTAHEDMIWIRELFFDNNTRTDKTVIFGHTPCLHLHGKEDIWFGGDKIGIDGACAYGFQLNCLEIKNDGYKTHFINVREVCEE